MTDNIGDASENVSKDDAGIVESKNVLEEMLFYERVMARVTDINFEIESHEVSSMGSMRAVHIPQGVKCTLEVQGLSPDDMRKLREIISIHRCILPQGNQEREERRQRERAMQSEVNEERRQEEESSIHDAMREGAE